MKSTPEKVDKDVRPPPSGGGLDDLQTPIWHDDIPDELWDALKDAIPKVHQSLIQKVRYKLQENQAKAVNAHTVLSLFCAAASIHAIRGPAFGAVMRAQADVSRRLIALAEEIKAVDVLSCYYDIPNQTRVREIIREENQAMEQRILSALHANRDHSDTTHYKKCGGKSWKWHGSGDPDSGLGEWRAHSFKNWTSKS